MTAQDTGLVRGSGQRVPGQRPCGGRLTFQYKVSNSLQLCLAGLCLPAGTQTPSFPLAAAGNISDVTHISMTYKEQQKAGHDLKMLFQEALWLLLQRELKDDWALPLPLAFSIQLT